MEPHPAVEPDPPARRPDIRYGTPDGRWIVAAAALGSGMAFLDGTVVNVALPTIGRALGTSIAGLQWTVNAYLVTLSALLLLGGSLGDRLGRRRVFVIGVGAFTAASVLCGLAPSTRVLVAARALQGAGGALIVPGSLAIIAASFHPDDRGRAIGAWSGLAGIASAAGPLVGGWLIDTVSWRLIFLVNVPVAVVTAWIAARHVPETRASQSGAPDVAGALLVTTALTAGSYAAIRHSGAASAAAAVVAAAAMVAFLAVEWASAHPMLPLTLFRSRRFAGANATTLAVYAALGGAIFLVVMRLQVSLGYSPLAAGAAFTPFTAIMLLWSSTTGRLGQRTGPRLPMTAGPLVAAAGLWWLGGIGPGDGYIRAVLPGVALFGAGMTITVPPLTTAVLASVPDAFAGVASGVNNAVARLAGLLAVAGLPALVGMGADQPLGAALDTGFKDALRLCAGLCAAGGLVAALVVRGARPVRAVVQPSPFAACHDACVLEDRAGEGRAGRAGSA